MQAWHLGQWGLNTELEALWFWTTRRVGITDDQFTAPAITELKSNGNLWLVLVSCNCLWRDSNLLFFFTHLDVQFLCHKNNADGLLQGKKIEPLISEAKIRHQHYLVVTWTSLNPKQFSHLSCRRRQPMTRWLFHIPTPFMVGGLKLSVVQFSTNGCWIALNTSICGFTCLFFLFHLGCKWLIIFIVHRTFITGCKCECYRISGHGPHFSVLPFSLSRKFPDDMSSGPKFSAKRGRLQVHRLPDVTVQMFTGLDYNPKPMNR